MEISVKLNCTTNFRLLKLIMTKVMEERLLLTLSVMIGLRVECPVRPGLM